MNTDESEQLMKLLNTYFDKLSLTETPIKQKQLNNLLKILYNDIKLADNWASAEDIVNKVRAYLKKSSKFEDVVPQWILQETKYIPECVRTYIKEHFQGYLIYKCEIGSRKIEIIFGLLQDHDNESMAQFDEYVKKMITWLKIAFLYAPEQCSKTLKIYGFLTPFRKELPDNQFSVLSPNNCNSAVTTSCQTDGEIIIYRKEEFIKVFIHETFHSLGLDFSAMSLGGFNKKVQQQFPLDSDFNLFEAYTEFWAGTMNGLITAYGALDDKDDVEAFLLYSDFFLKSEQIFSLFQMIKTLDFMGLKYNNLYDNDGISTDARRHLFKENTNVFAYYIIKNLLFYNNADFIMWCRDNNANILEFKKTTLNLESFLKFIISNHNNNDLLNDVEKMDVFLQKMKRRALNSGNNKLYKTMRMSMCDAF